MKSNSRKYHNCILCGGTGVNREHIFQRSIASRIDNETFVSAPRPSFPLGKRRSGGTRALFMTSYTICETCNEQLGRMTLPTKDDLSNLILGNIHIIEEEKVSALRIYFKKIGAIYDAETAAFDKELMIEAAADIEFNKEVRYGPQILSKDERRQFLSAWDMPSISVHLARHSGILGRTFEMNSCQAMNALTRTPVAKRFMFALEHLAVIISVGPFFRRIEGRFIDIDSVKRNLDISETLCSDIDFIKNYARTPDIEAAIRYYSIPGNYEKMVKKLDKKTGKEKSRIKVKGMRP